MGRLGGVCGGLGPLLGALGPLLGALGPSLEGLGRLLRHLEGVLASFATVLTAPMRLSTGHFGMRFVNSLRRFTLLMRLRLNHHRTKKQHAKYHAKISCID